MPFRRSAIVLIFSFISAIYLIWSWSSILGEFGGDNANYLLMARYFSPYSAESSIASYFASSSFYPPLFPFLLGITGGGESLLVAHLVTTFILLIAFVVFYWWLRNERIHPSTAIASLIILAIIPGIYIQTLSIHSENLYLLCSLIACVFAGYAKKEKTINWMGLAILAIAAAYFTRTAALALIVAWLVWLWANRLPHRFLFSALAICPILIWSLYGPHPTNSYLQQLIGGYHSHNEILGQIATQSLYLLQGWVMNFGTDISAYAVATIFLVFGLIAAAWRIWLRHLDGLYIAFYLAMTVIWPFSSEAQRLSIIMLPVLLGQTIWMLNQWQLSGGHMRPWAWGMLAGIALTALPKLAINSQSYFSPLPDGVSTAYRHAEWWYLPTRKLATENITAMAAMESGIRNVRNSVPENECIYAIKPSIVAYLSDRLVKAPPAETTPPLEFERQIAAEGCRYFLMMSFTSPSYSTPIYPYPRISDELQVLELMYLSPDKHNKSIVGLLAKLK